MDRCIDVALTSENPDVSEVGLAKGENGKFCVIDIPLPDVQTKVSSGS